MGVLILLVYVVVFAIVAIEFGNIAELKGYDKTKYAWYTFFFSVAGMLMVVALPEKDVTKTNEKITDELPEL